MRAFEIVTGHVIYNPAYTYKFQLKTTNKELYFLFGFNAKQEEITLLAFTLLPKTSIS